MPKKIQALQIIFKSYVTLKSLKLSEIPIITWLFTKQKLQKKVLS